MQTWRLHREDLLKDEEWQAFKVYLDSRINKNWTNTQDHAICMISIWTGLRRSEIANLNITDLFLYPVRPFIVVRHGKGDRYREVLISDDCKNYLEGFIHKRISQGKALFIPQRGERYTGDGIYRVWTTALKDAKLPHRSIHKARHYNGSKLYEITKDPKFVQEQLGHSRLSTTEVYIHLNSKQAEQHLKNFDNIIKS